MQLNYLYIIQIFLNEALSQLQETTKNALSKYWTRKLDSWGGSNRK